MLLSEDDRRLEHLIGYHLALELASTIADLAGRDMPGRDELAIALAIRRGEQPGTVKQEAIGS